MRSGLTGIKNEPHPEPVEGRGVLLPVPESNPAADRAVARWLLACCAMIFVMVIIGGITRLTESGLSITEWRPLSGVLPPLSAADWQREFALYQQIPEFQQLKSDMTLEEFKGIFWWEYVHRLCGRIPGAPAAAPDTPIPRAAPRRHVRARRAARGTRVVHGAERPERADRCEPVSPCRAFPGRAGDLFVHVLDRSDAVAPGPRRRHRPAAAPASAG